MAILYIPKQQIAVIRKLSELTDSQFSDLLKGLNEIEASLSSDDFSRHLYEKVQTIPKGDIESIVGMLCGIYPAKENNNKTASQIAADIKDTLEEEKPPNIALDKASLIEDRVNKLLSVDKAIAVTAKAYDVVTEHQNLFSNARIFSDIRPVFSTDADSVSAAVVIHTLNISYQQAGDRKDFYAALDKSDIELLKKVIERAEKKAQVLQSIIQKADITYLEAGA